MFNFNIFLQFGLLITQSQSVNYVQWGMNNRQVLYLEPDTFPIQQTQQCCSKKFDIICLIYNHPLIDVFMVTPDCGSSDITEEVVLTRAQKKLQQIQNSYKKYRA